MWFLFAATYITAALRLAVPLAREGQCFDPEAWQEGSCFYTSLGCVSGVTRVQIRLDTDERKRTPRFSPFLLSLTLSFSYEAYRRNIPMETFSYSRCALLWKIRAGAAELSLIISERLDPRIRLLLVIQFTRDVIINGELILFRTRLCFTCVQNLVRNFEQKFPLPITFIRWI